VRHQHNVTLQQNTVLKGSAQLLGWGLPMPNAAAKATSMDTAKIHVYASYILAKLGR
jgi:hypothetical protein